MGVAPGLEDGACSPWVGLLRASKRSVSAFNLKLCCPSTRSLYCHHFGESKQCSMTLRARDTSDPHSSIVVLYFVLLRPIRLELGIHQFRVFVPSCPLLLLPAPPPIGLSLGMRATFHFSPHVRCAKSRTSCARCFDEIRTLGPNTDAHTLFSAHAFRISLVCFVLKYCSFFRVYITIE